MNGNTRAVILLEDMNAKFDAIMEVLTPMQEKVDRIPKIEEDIAELKTDVKTIKFALTATNRQVTDHERRITRLEATAP